MCLSFIPEPRSSLALFLIFRCPLVSAPLLVARSFFRFLSLFLPFSLSLFLCPTNICSLSWKRPTIPFLVTKCPYCFEMSNGHTGPPIKKRSLATCETKLLEAHRSFTDVRKSTASCRRLVLHSVSSLKIIGPGEM